MIFETFKHMCIAAIGMLESERETKLDFTNQNGVEFETLICLTIMDEFYLGLQISFENDDTDQSYIEDFLRLKNAEGITAKHIIDATIIMADFIEDKKNIDQYDLQELNKRHHENN